MRLAYTLLLSIDWITYMTKTQEQKRRKSGKMQLKEDFWGYLFILPVLIGIVVFVAIPMFLTVYASFTAWPGGASIFNWRLIGFRNYQYILFEDPLFWRSIGNTLFYMIGIPIGLALSLLAALGMNRAIRGAQAFRVIYYIPAISSPVAISLLFRFMFDYRGIVNQMLFFLPDLRWGLPPWDRVSLIILMVWRGLGGSALLFLAGLQGVSQSYYEAARLDGASRLQMTVKITVPMLMPVIFFLVVTGVIGGAQLYVEPNMIFGNDNRYIMTVVQHIFELRFSRLRGNVASAASVVLAALIFFVTAVQFWINGRREKA